MAKGTIFQLTPFFVFVGLFVFSTLLSGSSMCPLFACILAIVYSFFTFTKKTSLNKKMELLVAGSSRPIVITMCYIFIFSSILTHILSITGGINAAVTIGLSVIPCAYILPGLFIIVSIFATAVGSSIGAIAAFLPISMGIAQQLGINPPLMAGTIIGAAILGDNLSIISDTTIACIKSIDVDGIKKFKTNFFLVLPAFFLTLILLIHKSMGLQLEPYTLTTTITLEHIIAVLPYCVIFLLALTGLDVIFILLVAIFTALTTGVWLGHFTFTQSTNLIVQGFTHSSRNAHFIILFTLLIAGLTYIIEHNGGITYLINKIKTYIHHKSRAEIIVALLALTISLTIASGTITILILAPIVKTIAHKYKLSKTRLACLLDTFSCLGYGILPYGAPLLLASSITGVSTLSIIPYLYYQLFVFIAAIGSIAYNAWAISRSQKQRKKEKKFTPAIITSSEAFHVYSKRNTQEL